MGSMSKERYPGNLNAANPMFFPVLKDYANLPLYQGRPGSRSDRLTVAIL